VGRIITEGDEMPNIIDIKFRYVAMVILLILWSLSTVATTYALMPLGVEKVEKKEEPQKISAPQQGTTDIMPEEEISVTEEKIADEIKRTKEEKKKIIAEAKKKKIPEQRKPFIKEGPVEKNYYSLKLKKREMEPIERHDVIIGGKPVELILALLILSIIIYLLYRLLMNSRPRQ
jgi:hypothetical protein